MCLGSEEQTPDKGCDPGVIRAVCAAVSEARVLGHRKTGLGDNLEKPGELVHFTHW